MGTRPGFFGPESAAGSESARVVPEVGAVGAAAATARCTAGLRAQGYCTIHRHRMNCRSYWECGLMIGSSLVESARIGVVHHDSSKPECGRWRCNADTTLAVRSSVEWPIWPLDPHAHAPRSAAHLIC